MTEIRGQKKAREMLASQVFDKVKEKEVNSAIKSGEGGQTDGGEGYEGTKKARELRWRTSVRVGAGNKTGFLIQQ